MEKTKTTSKTSTSPDQPIPTITYTPSATSQPGPPTTTVVVIEQPPCNPCCCMPLQTGLKVIAMIQIIWSTIVSVVLGIVVAIVIIFAERSDSEESNQKRNQDKDLQKATLAVLCMVGALVCLVSLGFGTVLYKGAKKKDVKRLKCYMVWAVIVLILSCGSNLWMWYCLICVICFIKEIQFEEAVKNVNVNVNQVMMMEGGQIVQVQQQDHQQGEPPKVGGGGGGAASASSGTGMMKSSSRKSVDNQRDNKSVVTEQSQDDGDDDDDTTTV